MPTPAARRLNTYSRQHKFLFLCFFLPIVFFPSAYLTSVPFVEMEAARQRVLIRALVVAHKQKEKEGGSSSAPNVVIKGSSKRKNKGKDDRPLKKGPGTPASNKQSK